MRNLLIVFYTIALTSTYSYSQGCLPNGIRFESQIEISNFSVNNPDCTVLESYLEVGTAFLPGTNNPPITNLLPLSQVEEIKGYLRINSYTNIKNFRGLENLTKIGGDLYVGNGFKMDSFEGLSSLDSIMGSVRINYSDVTALSGLSNLKYIGGSIIINNAPITDLDIPNLNHLGGLSLIDCPSLEDLNGFQNLTEINSILLDNMENLSEISGFTSLQKITGKLELTERHNLTDVGGLSSVDSIGTLKFFSTYSTTLSFPNLTEVGDLIYESISQQTLEEHPKLDTIHNNLEILYTSATNILWGDNIKAIKGGLVISNNSNLESITGLENIEGLQDLTITQNYSLISLNGFNAYTSLRNVTIDRSIKNIAGLQSLQEVANLDIETTNTIETTAGFQQLTIVHNNASIKSSTVLGLKAFDALTEIGNNFYFASYTSPTGSEDHYIFPNLTTIGGDLSLEHINGLSTFKSIETIGGTLSFLHCYIQDFSGFEKLAQVNRIKLDNTDATSFDNLSSFAGDSTSLVITKLRDNPNLAGLESVTSLKGLSFYDNDNVESVAGLSGLTKIHETFYLSDNEDLHSLAPMSNLKSVGSLYFTDSDLDTLLRAIETITGSIDMRDISSLENLDDLQSLKHLGNGLKLDDNPSLKNLDGFQNIETFSGSIVLTSNDRLNDINGLASIPNPELIDYIQIRFNNDLDECNLNVFCEYLQLLDKESEISGNGESCDEDGIYCSEYSISGYFFYDENENGIKDDNEHGLSYGCAYIREKEKTIKVDAQGLYHFYAFVDSTYTIDYKLYPAIPSFIDNWQLTTAPNHTITFSKGDPQNSQLNFGFTPTYISNTCINFSSYSFTSQEKIDAFPYEYPWCNVLNSKLYIKEDEDGNILDLSPFSQLSYVRDEVTVRENNELESLIGLHNIQHIDDDLILSSLPKVDDLGALSQLKTLNGRLSIRGIDQIENLYGIANLDHTTVSNLSIRYNDILSVCDVPFVCKYISANPETYTINANASECNEEELGGCIDDFIGGIVFYDTNGNKIKDANDYGVPQYPIQIDGNTILSTQMGNYYIYGEMGNQYNMSIELKPEFELTTDSLEYTEVYEMGISTNDHDFGIRYKEEVKQSTLNISSGNTRCFETINFIPTITNEGTPVINSRMEFTLDPRTRLVGYLVEPTGFDTLNHVYWWESDTLYTYQTISQTLKIEMPDFNAIGDTLHFELSLFEGDDVTPLNTYHYSSIVRCSYDPNDKQVNPMGLGDENYTLFNDSLLTYTIRFQNTGNDYAKNIRITDTLSHQLDVETFKVVNSSFPVLTSINGPYVEFSFRDIYLPDSTTNEAGSHGFVTYEIETISDLPEDEVIQNTAHIYFDFNPPIVTNTTLNTMVSMYPEVVSTKEITYLDVTLVPNPTRDIFSIVNQSGKAIKESRIYNQQGVLIIEYKNQESIDISALTPGYYIVNILLDDNVVSIPLIKM